MMSMDYLALPTALFGVMAIAAMGLQLVLGGAGLLTLGHMAFFAIGGYSSAAWVMFIAPLWGITSPVMQLVCGLTVAMGVTGLCAWVVATPCLRLRGDYLAAATLAFSQITESVCNNLEIVGGASGFTNIPKLASLWVIWACVLAVGIFLHRFYTTGIGHAILCARDDELVARCFAISTERAKLLGFVLGGTITGLAGALSAHTFQFISPTAAGFQKSVEILLAVVIGGMFSIWGSIIGAGILVWIPELLRFVPGPMQGLLSALQAAGIISGRVGDFVLACMQNSLLLFALIVLLVLKQNAAGLGSGLTRWQQRVRRA